MKKLKLFKVEFEWEIHDTRKGYFGYKEGKSTIQVNTYDELGVINYAITFCEYIPSYELERNNIDIEEFREGNTCSYHYYTKLKIINKVERIA